MPDSSDALTSSLRALSSFLLGGETPREALLEIARLGEAALPTDTRWPAFSERACQQGVLSSLSTPLVADDRSMGALNFYGLEEGAFSEEDERLGVSFAAQAAIVVSNAQAYWGALEKSINLDEAMRSRAGDQSEGKAAR